MLTNKQVKSNVTKRGMLDDMYKEIRKYGIITYDFSEDVDSGHYAGANRHLHILYRGIEYNIEMLNGEVRVFEWKE